MRSVAILRSNPVNPDPRVEKAAEVLKRNGWQVSIFAWDRTSSLPSRTVEHGVVVYRLRLKARFGSGLANLPKLLQWQLWLMYWLLRHRTSLDCVHACDFDTVVPALVLKLLNRKVRVVYDIFDFYADTVHGLPKWLRNWIRKVDLHCAGLVDAVILADEARRDQLEGPMPRRIEIIYNSPQSMPPQIDATTQRSEPGHLRIAYVGVLYRERGIEHVVNVLSRHPNWSMDLAGFGGDQEAILEKIHRLQNVRFHGRVPYDFGLQLAQQADVLFATYDPAIPNHRYSSANKLFEAMMLGKPIIVASGTGMDRTVKQFSLGFVVQYGDEQALEEALETVASWTDLERDRFAVHTRAVYKEHYAWDIMESRLRLLYERLYSEDGSSNAAAT